MCSFLIVSDQLYLLNWWKVFMCDLICYAYKNIVVLYWCGHSTLKLSVCFIIVWFNISFHMILIPFLHIKLLIWICTFVLILKLPRPINCVEWNSVSKIWINCTSFKYFYRCMYLNTYGRNWWILNFQKSRGSLISPGIEPMMRALTHIGLCQYGPWLRLRPIWVSLFYMSEVCNKYFKKWAFPYWPGYHPSTHIGLLKR
jgi:hypothetical protein